MNVLTVDYDDDGNRHYYRDGVEVEEAVYMTQHPHMKTPKGNRNGRAGSSDGGQLGVSDSGIGAVAAAAQVNEQPDDVKAQVRQGIRDQRKQARAEAGDSAGPSGDGVGQP